MNNVKYKCLAFFLFLSLLSSKSEATLIKNNTFNPIKTDTMNLNDKDLIKKIFQDYVHLWNKHNMQSWGDLFTKDTDFITWSGAWFTSNAVNLAEHRKAHITLKKQQQNMTYELSIEKISFTNTSTAIVHATWYWPDFKTSNGQENRKGILTMILIKENETWLIRATQNTRIN